ncbi:MAG: DUF962 domain-containing protein [Planctomycetota bacterium]
MIHAEPPSGSYVEEACPETEGCACFGEFYPAYLADHQKPATRVWHVLGTLGLFAAVLLAAISMTWWLLLVGVIVAYGAAWLSHLLVEHNRPRTFKQPLYSVLGDFKMTYEILTLQRPLREPVPQRVDAQPIRSDR